MKVCIGHLYSILALSAASSASVGAFSFAAGVPPRRRVGPTSTAPPRIRASSSAGGATLRMSDFDFPSAMPEKPRRTMKEKMEESATQFIADLSTRLGDGVDPPPEMEALREARDSPDGDERTLALKIYELMIEQGMTYDVDPETGRLTPTQFDVKNNLDVPEVKSEFKHLYSYGMELIKRGLIELDTCKDIVKTRLIDRTGLSPEEFDKWLGY
mmetsp:Transcript_53166/g.112989  ORF Transcript_53166/g.112989 Transcript_53166/m.112989 type:complete len:214 (+) Transcript_53166:123-764(+)